MAIVIILFLLIIGFLVYRLYQKQEIDKAELEEYRQSLRVAKKDWEQALSVKNQVLNEYHTIKTKCDYEEEQLEECKQELQDALNTYHDLVDNKLKNIDQSIEDQRLAREQELNNEFNTKIELYDRLIHEKEQQAQQVNQEVEGNINLIREQSNKQIAIYQTELDEIKDKVDSTIRIFSQYEKEQQEKLFYTIQLPEEFHDDIEFLLTTVAAKVQHPDIISKLVWTEYVKPNIENTFKRIEIRPEPGIYKLTSLINGKCYIGKSTNVKTRIADHFKSAVGIRSIADQAVHHAILKEGFWNWQIEIITYCEKDKLSELEKYYIEFFKAQEYGYNKTGGG